MILNKDNLESVERIVEKTLSVIEKAVESGIDFSNQNETQNILNLIDSLIKLDDLFKS
ncbi:hypothetical protein [Bacillus licheniformis]|uniref:hypothetical protein n=1 Tax=Bacillus licheniformis TaxID=1402 RepID=UPI002E24A684|nr:hypothetical protein [Bacillus licheniformis]MED4342379.1 hypothetical protein [Bacillus licheniformis]MED4374021.1 hypothetical protein [Bacillus licheniformis]MED4382757.1 hypothetical protein [Bacillus licheniformis]MED4411061.1 hypothetical protein [Bacillus licheniformis]